MLDLVKQALMITTDAYDDLLEMHIDSAIQDLKMAGLTYDDEDPAFQDAIICWCKANFGEPSSDYMKIYDDKKAKMQMSSLYGLEES